MAKSWRQPTYSTQSYKGDGTKGTVAAVAVSVAVVLIAALVFNILAGPRDNNDIEGAEGEGLEPSPVQKVKVTFAGDCVLGKDKKFDNSTSFNAKYKAKGPEYFLKKMKKTFNGDDITVVGLEGNLTNSTKRRGVEFAYKGSPKYAKVFSSSGVDAVCVANNHAYDYDVQGFKDTQIALTDEGLDVFGYDNIAYVDANGVKVALIGVDALAKRKRSFGNTKKRIAAAKENGADLILVYMHWGDEKKRVPNKTQMELGRVAIDEGADLVVGAHSHVIQGYEVYNGRYIVYGLGNFCFGGNTKPYDMDCILFQQTFSVKDGDVEKNDKVKVIPCRVSTNSKINNYQPMVAKGKAKARILAKVKKSNAEIKALAKKYKF